MPQDYEIHVRGRVPDAVLLELANMCPALLSTQTVLRAAVSDAVALRGLQQRMQGLGVEVLESRLLPVVPAPSGPHEGLAFTEPLTLKETEVLGYLSELYSTEEIADSMFVSVNTVRTHIRSVLRKLGVSRRNAAVRRARQLGVLPWPPTRPPEEVVA